MWLMSLLLLPSVRTDRQYRFIEAAYSAAVLEWLLQWVDSVSVEFADLYPYGPFSLHGVPPPIETAVSRVRHQLHTCLSDDDIEWMAWILQLELVRFANQLATWRGKAVRSEWSGPDLVDLVDLSKYIP